MSTTAIRISAFFGSTIKKKSNHCRSFLVDLHTASSSLGKDTWASRSSVVAFSKEFLEKVVFGVILGY